MTKADAKELKGCIARSNARFDRYIATAIENGADALKLADLRCEKARAVRSLANAYAD